VTIHTAKPGIVIGKGGANVEVLRQQIGALTSRKVKLEIKEIRQPELDAYLVAMNIAGQLSRRIAFKKAMKQAIQRSMKAARRASRSPSPVASVAPRWAAASGTRKAGSRSARSVPTSATGRSTPTRPYGRIGVKVWIYRGDITPERAARDAGIAAPVGTGV
jgi:small subunit ribosomal protein S3